MPPAGIRGYTIVGVGWRRAVPPIAEEQTGNGRDEGRDRHTVSEGVAFCWKCDKALGGTGTSMVRKGWAPVETIQSLGIGASVAIVARRTSCRRPITGRLPRGDAGVTVEGVA